MGGIDGGRRLSVDVDHHVADDADDLARVPAAEHGDALADDALERHPRKRDARQVGAHDCPHRRARVVAVVERPARQHRNRERLEEFAADRAMLRILRLWHLRSGQRAGIDEQRPRVKRPGGGEARRTARPRHAGDRREPPRQVFLKDGAPGGVVADAREVHVEREDAIDAEPEVDFRSAGRSSPTGRRRRRGAPARARVARRRGRFSVSPAGACRSTSATAASARRFGSLLARRSAGITPHASAVAIVTTAANRRTTGSKPTESRRGSASRPSVWRAFTPSAASASPARPPNPARTRLSIRSCRASRPRLEPRAARIANSWTRPLARTRTRFATFTHATSSTSPTAISQQLQQVPRRPGDVVLQRQRGETAGFGVRPAALRRLAEYGELSSCLLEADARPQPGEHRQRVVLGQRVVLEIVRAATRRWLPRSDPGSPGARFPPLRTVPHSSGCSCRSMKGRR